MLRSLCECGSFSSNKPNEWSDLDRLTRMIYATSENVINTVDTNGFHSFPARFNQMICTAHQLKFSDRSILKNHEILFLLWKIRKHVRLQRKSSVALIHMKKSFSLFKRLQTATTTLYHKIDSIIRDVHHSMSCELCSYSET